MNDKEINKFIKDIIAPAFGFEFINNFASEKSRKSNETKDCAQMVAAYLAYRKKFGSKRIWETRGLWGTSIAFEVMGFDDQKEFYIEEE